MSVLIFPFPRSEKITALYALDRVDESKPIDGCDQGPEFLTLRKPFLLRKGNLNSTTYRGILRHGSRSVADVVCKLAFGEDNLRRLRHEATMYNGPLKCLQRNIVPKFFGYYEAEMEGKMYGCLVTEYCGERSKVPFEGLPWKTKGQLVQALARVHDAGVKHGDFRECNVVFTPNGVPVIIDFDHAELHHCQPTMPIIFHDPTPFREDFKCDELFEACQGISVWKPRYLRAFFMRFPAEYAEDPHKLAACAPEGMDPELAMEEAQGAIQDYKRYLYRRSKCDWGGPKDDNKEEKEKEEGIESS